MAFDLLIKMQPSRNRRKEGEVFVIQPLKDIFFFGKVIRTKISIKDPIMNGGHLVYIFNETSCDMEPPEHLNPNNLIISPQIINDQGWTKGYFKTVGVQKVTGEECKVDY
ncbi:immunity 26/phosphotriesterase HocA family protein [Bacillus timonensis]|nr:immunity 26/phosphotriesterase HocA family protein [Bacillus timonensis]